MVSETEGIKIGHITESTNESLLTTYANGNSSYIHPYQMHYLFSFFHFDISYAQNIRIWQFLFSVSINVVPFICSLSGREKIQIEFVKKRINLCWGNEFLYKQNRWFITGKSDKNCSQATRIYGEIYSKETQLSKKSHEKLMRRFD